MARRTRYSLYKNAEYPFSGVRYLSGWEDAAGKYVAK